MIRQKVKDSFKKKRDRRDELLQTNVILWNMQPLQQFKRALLRVNNRNDNLSVTAFLQNCFL